MVGITSALFGMHIHATSENHIEWDCRVIHLCIQYSTCICRMNNTRCKGHHIGVHCLYAQGMCCDMERPSMVK